MGAHRDLCRKKGQGLAESELLKCGRGLWGYRGCGNINQGQGKGDTGLWLEFGRGCLGGMQNKALLEAESSLWAAGAWGRG